MTNKEEKIEIKVDDSQIKAKKASSTNKDIKEPTKKNLEVENELLKKQIASLRTELTQALTKNIELKFENDKNLSNFKEKAQSFQKKAQEEIDRVKTELTDKTVQAQKEYKLYAIQKLLENIIDPIANLELAVKAGESQGPEVKSYVIGFKMLLDQLFNEFETIGLTKIEPIIGSEFNPDFHQAISTKEGKANIILSLSKPGFSLNNRVLKPALVIIGQEK